MRKQFGKTSANTMPLPVCCNRRCMLIISMLFSFTAFFKMTFTLICFLFVKPKQLVSYRSLLVAKQSYFSRTTDFHGLSSRYWSYLVGIDRAIVERQVVGDRRTYARPSATCLWIISHLSFDSHI